MTNKIKKMSINLKILTWSFVKFFLLQLVNLIGSNVRYVPYVNSALRITSKKIFDDCLVSLVR